MATGIEMDPIQTIKRDDENSAEEEKGIENKKKDELISSDAKKKLRSKVRQHDKERGRKHKGRKRRGHQDSEEEEDDESGENITASDDGKKMKSKARRESKEIGSKHKSRKKKDDEDSEEEDESRKNITSSDDEKKFMFKALQYGNKRGRILKIRIKRDDKDSDKSGENVTSSDDGKKSKSKVRQDGKERGRKHKNRKKGEHEDYEEIEENVTSSDDGKKLKSKARQDGKERGRKHKSRKKRDDEDSEEEDESRKNFTSSDDEKKMKSKNREDDKERESKNKTRKQKDHEDSEEEENDESGKNITSSDDEKKLKSKARQDGKERRRVHKSRKKKDHEDSEEEEDDDSLETITSSDDEKKLKSKARQDDKIRGKKHKTRKKRDHKESEEEEDDANFENISSWDDGTDEEDSDEEEEEAFNIALDKLLKKMETLKRLKKRREEKRRGSKKVQFESDDDDDEQSDDDDLVIESDDDDEDEESDDDEEESDDSSDSIDRENDIHYYQNLKDNLCKCKTFTGLKIEEAYEGDQIKEGQRVVLSPEYERNNKDDSGIGFIGTILKVKNDTVCVLWDSKEKSEEYKTTDDLLLLDNAQTGAVHKGYSCSGCKENLIRGIKWSCCICDDFHLCTGCYMHGTHSLCHEFERKNCQKSRSIKIGIRSDDFETKNFRYADGVFPDARVTLRSDKNVKGKVQEIKDKSVRMFDCDASVTWKDNQEQATYRVGREGHVDLICRTPGKGLSYYEEHLQIITKENAKPGMRVVAKNELPNSSQYVGTVIPKKYDISKSQKSSNISTKHRKGQGSSDPNMKLEVQWDNGRIGNEIEESKPILLYDNRQIGVEHSEKCHKCDKSIKGTRWQCEKNIYSLCTSCYMSDKGDVKSRFFRMDGPFKSKRLPQSRAELGSDKKIQAIGLFEGAEVFEIDNEHRFGTISRISNYKINSCRSKVHVQWDDGYSVENDREITEILWNGESQAFRYLPSHLPKLQEDMHGYVKIENDMEQITVDLRFGEEDKTELVPEKKIPYFLFGDDKNESKKFEKRHIALKEKKILRRLMILSKKTKIPCLYIAAKVLILQGKVIVHPQTCKSTIEELKDFAESLGQGTTDDKESIVEYFQRMARAHSECFLIPVVISMRDNSLHEQIVANALSENIPVLFFKKSIKEACIAFFEENVNKGESTKVLSASMYHFDVNVPWKVKEFSKGLFFNIDHASNYNTNLIIDMLEEIKDYDAVVCCMMIAVTMTVDILKYSEEFKENYSNALSTFLLKSGKWRFPINPSGICFNHHSIEYIFEKKLTEEFRRGLWKDLKRSTNNAYLLPAWKENKLEIEESEFFGLVFLALLTRNFYTGALQFLKTGYVKIHYILIGCVILRNAADDWKTSEVDKEKLHALINKFSYHALRIISCIHENDKQTDRKKRLALELEQNPTRKIGKFHQHAGRLLLNHGYLSDGIQTNNKIFLENVVVKNVLNHIWYGGESLTVLRVAGFLLLTVFHFLFLPPLMITVERNPFKWFYRQYKVPFMKVCLNVFSHLALLVIYAYMLLFDLDEGISASDVFIIFWMANFFTDELMQVIVARKRNKLTQYRTDKWNVLDWTCIVIYLCGMLVKLAGHDGHINPSKVLLVATYILFCIRILHMFCVSELLGPKLVMIQKMFLDTFAFMTIMFVILMCFNVSYYSILYAEKSDFTFEQLEKITKNGYWLLFGELNLDGDKLKEPECTFNHSIYSTGSIERCPSALGISLAPYLKAVYALITIILLLNLLIAMYSKTFSEVHAKSTLYWSQLQTNFLDEFGVKSIFPVHMRLLSFLFCLIHALAYIINSSIHTGISKCCNSPCAGGGQTTAKEKDPPLFIRVFLYDSKYDTKMSRTEELETRAALMVKRELEITDDGDKEDKSITDLEESLNFLTDEYHEFSQKY